MKPTNKSKIAAKEIADRLFHNGQGEEAERLVLELSGQRDGGGWCREAVINQIEDVLKKILVNK